MTTFNVVIPARYASSRFPGKPLADVHGKPMLEHVYMRAVESGAQEVWVATDDKRIQDAAIAFGADVCLTRVEHQSGTDRIVEVVQKQVWSDDTIVVNVQGDEPFIPSENIRQVAANLVANFEASIATLRVQENIAEIENPNIVKVVAGAKDMALYFSRAPIPYGRDQQEKTFSRHVGIYAYSVAYLHRFAEHQVAAIESIEQLEQLRALWYGEKIHVADAAQPPPIGVDTPEDLQRLLEV